MNSLPVDLPDGGAELGEQLGVIEGRSPWQLAWARLRRDRVALVCLIVIALIVGVALAAPLVAYLTGHGPNEQFQTAGLDP